MDEETLSLAKTLFDEMVSAAGLPRIPLFQGLFWLPFRGVTTRFGPPMTAAAPLQAAKT
jgi:hypothetical protein